MHLVKTWLPTLEKKIEEQSEGSHANYRYFQEVLEYYSS